MSAQDLFSQGYTDLVSVIPPDAELTPSSSIKPESRGKSPGVLYPSGWGGYNWRVQATSPAFISQIDATKANIGLAAAKFPAIDVDVKDPGLAALIANAIEDILPTGPVRIGAAPKRLYLFRLANEAQPFTKMSLTFDYAGQKQLVEVLGAGQQYLIEGIHATTKQPYTYNSPLPSASELPELTRDLADAVLSYISTTVLDFLGIEHRRSGNGLLAERGHKSQDHLKADVVDLAMAMSSVRDTEDVFPSRQEYIKFGIALRAATQDDPELGLQLFQNWAATKDWGVENDPIQVERDWVSFHAPFEIGADYVFQIARKFGYGTPGDEFEFEPAPPAEVVEVRRSHPKQESKRAAAAQSDMWLTDKLIDLVGDEIVWQPQRGKWLAYDNGIWKEDLSATINSHARSICVDEANRILQQGATEKEKLEASKQAKSLSSSRQLGAILNLAQQNPRVIVQQEKFDANPDLLGTPDGVIDLLTGQRVEPHPEMYISKSTTVAPGPPSALWRQFLDDACAGDVEFEDYLQKVAGYCLTAHTYESLLFFLWGEGKRGKSTFVDTLSAVLGSYAKVAQMSTFTAKKTDRHTTELAALAGARLVTAQETQENEYWDEARVKSLTGGDSVTARFLFKDDFTFVPGFKLLFSGNSRPKIQNADTAMRRRVHLIPFNNLPKVVDPRFKDKLKQNELPGVLTWMIEGAIKWREEILRSGVTGLRMPKIVEDATSAYFEQEDPFGRWQKDCLIWEGTCSGAKAYQSWTDWCDSHGESASTQRKFTTVAINRGMRRGADVNGQMTFSGVSLKGEAAMPVAGSEFHKEMVQ